MLNTHRPVADLSALGGIAIGCDVIREKDVQYSCNSHKCVKHLHVFFTLKLTKKRRSPVGDSGGHNFFLDLTPTADPAERALVFGLGQFAQAFW